MIAIYAKYQKCQEHYLGYDLCMYDIRARLARGAKYGCRVELWPDNCAGMRVMVN